MASKEIDFLPFLCCFWRAEGELKKIYMYKFFNLYLLCYWYLFPLTAASPYQCTDGYHEVPLPLLLHICRPPWPEGPCVRITYHYGCLGHGWLLGHCKWKQSVLFLAFLEGFRETILFHCLFVVGQVKQDLLVFTLYRQHHFCVCVRVCIQVYLCTCLCACMGVCVTYCSIYTYRNICLGYSYKSRFWFFSRTWAMTWQKATLIW